MGPKNHLHEVGEICVLAVVVSFMAGRVLAESVSTF